MNASVAAAGPLAGIKVVEIQGIGPGPFAAMVLAGLGASVIRVGRGGPPPRAPNTVLERGRAATIAVDMKSAAGKEKVLDLIGRADALIEGFRPGVMERLGLGPDECLARNPKLVYGRMTGWGRSGPAAMTAGHDINYIALTGALHACGTQESGPVPPLNLVGDFGGGGLLLVMGMVCAMLEAKTSGKGQIVDAAMVDGAGLLMSMMYGYRANGSWPAPRAGNIFDGSAYFYRCYETSDGGWMAVGAIEAEFRKIFFEKLGLADEAATLMRAANNDTEVIARIAAIFRSRTRDEWAAIFDGTDACVSPVLSIDEAPNDAHLAAWGSLEVVDGTIHPRPAPRFSRTPAMDARAAATVSGDLSVWGLSAAELGGA